MPATGLAVPSMFVEMRRDDNIMTMIASNRVEMAVRMVVDADAGGLRVDVHRFSRGDVWLAEGRRRIVVPQLALEP